MILVTGGAGYIGSHLVLALLEQVRDYINVDDLVNAHILALNYLKNGGKTNFFNLGTNEGNTVKEVFSICEKITNKTIPIEIKPRRAGDPAILIADNTKAKEVLGWTPNKTLEDSIKTAYEWEQKLNNCKKVASYAK